MNLLSRRRKKKEERKEGRKGSKEWTVEVLLLVLIREQTERSVGSRRGPLLVVDRGIAGEP